MNGTDAEYFHGEYKLRMFTFKFVKNYFDCIHILRTHTYIHTYVKLQRYTIRRWTKRTTITPIERKCESNNRFLEDMRCSCI